MEDMLSDLAKSATGRIIEDTIKSKIVREAVASEAHDIWDDWMTYMFTKCVENPNGSYTIPKDNVNRWKKQMATWYKNLPEEEKENDRRIADRYIGVILENA